MNPLPTSTSPALKPPSGRLLSVDALRGFDMLWIVGAHTIVSAFEKMSPHPATTFVATQLTHAQWDGFRFYDLIFPLFLFIVGVSLVFSLDKALADGGRGRVLGRVFRRSLLLLVIGIFYYGGLAQPWPDVQIGGVLPRIALCYFFAALIYTFVRNPKGIAATASVLLAGYWIVMTFVPFPDLRLEKPIVSEIAARIGSESPFDIARAVPERITGIYEEPRNLSNFVDFLFMPGKKAKRYYINEGLLSTVPSIALSLFGILAGLLLKNGSIAPPRKILWLLVCGAGACALGLLWSLQFPLIKRIWTSSFVLVASGLSACIVALFYWLVDVKMWRGWCQPFVWIGSNALTIYVVTSIVSFQTLAARFVGGDVQIFFDTHFAKGFGGLVTATLGLLLTIGFARFLFKRQIFLRV